MAMRISKKANEQAGAPSIVQVLYDTGALSLQWFGPGIGPTTPCTVVLSGTAGQFSYPAVGTTATINRDLSVGGPWTVLVTVAGVSSPSVSVVTAVATLRSVKNSGTAIVVNWTKATGVDESNVELVQQGSGQAQSWQTDQATLTIDQAVSGAGWSVAVRATATSGTASCFGPASRAAVIVDRPALVRVAYSGADTQLNWTSPAGAVNFLACLQQGSFAPQTKRVNGMTCSFNGALTGTGWSAAVSVMSADSISIGPLSPAVDVIVETVQMLRVSYLPPQLSLEWRPSAGQMHYVALLWSAQESYSQPTNARSAVFVGPYSGDGWRCAVCLQSADEVSVGPPGDVYQPLLAAPSLVGFDYDGANIRITWTNAPLPGATDNCLMLTSGGSADGYSVGTSGSATIEAVLSATQSYSATLYPTAGIVIGPPSQALIPITAPPAFVYLGFDGTSLVGMWDAPAGAVPTTYTATLFVDGTARESHAVAAAPLRFDLPPAPAARYTLQARSTAGAVVGPPCAATPGPYWAAQTFAFDGLGRLRTITWNGQQSMNWSYDASGNLLSQSQSSVSP